MTPYIAPSARQANAAAATSRQTSPVSPAENSAAGDPFAVHLDAAAEKVSLKRSDKNSSKDAKDAASAREAPPQQKPGKDAAKKSSEPHKKEDASEAEATFVDETAESTEQVDSAEVVAEAPEQIAVEDACHQQDSLFVQALLNHAPKKVEEVAPEPEGMQERPAATLNLPELPENSQPEPQAKTDAPKNSKLQFKADIPIEQPTQDSPKPESTVTPGAVEAPTPELPLEEKPAPRATPPHMDLKESHKDSGARKDASAGITQALATAVSDASAISQEAKPEFLPDVESNPAPAPMPIAAQHASNQPSLNAQSAESARAAQDSPRAAPENTFDQIVLGLRTKMDAANQKANIELNPPNLGKLHVSVELSNGILTAQFRTSTDVVRDLLSANMDRLRSVLEGQGIAVDKLAVSAGGATSEQNPQANTSTNQNAGHDGRSGGAFANDRHGPRQSSGEAFSKMWRAALEKEEPIDLLA